jgi:hypothetical protein
MTLGEEMKIMRTPMAGLTGLVALSLGCGTGRSAPSEPAPQPGSEQAARGARGQTQVQIDNQNFNDMDIYLIDAGTRVYLGSVTGLSKGSLTIPLGASRSSFQVRLLADPIGAFPPIRMPSVLVGPGQNVYWTIGSSPGNSFASAD